MPRSPYKAKRPTEPQARLLALVWGNPNDRGVPLNDEGYNNPTSMVCVKEGWFEKSGHSGTWPNGSTYTSYKVSTKGLLALEIYLADIRYKAN